MEKLFQLWSHHQVVVVAGGLLLMGVIVLVVRAARRGSGGKIDRKPAGGATSMRDESSDRFDFQDGSSAVTQDERESVASEPAIFEPIAPEPDALASEAAPVSDAVQALQAVFDETAESTALDGMATAPTQPAMASFAAAFEKSTVSRGLEIEDLALRYAADTAVGEARSGPPVEELWKAVAAARDVAGAEEPLYRFGLALAAVGRWTEAREVFLRADKVAPGYRDARARAQEIGRWQAAVGITELAIPQAGESAKRYTLLGELGRGSAAVVYRVRDEALGRELALKLLVDEESSDPAEVARLEREAREVARLSHRNIATLFDVGHWQDKVFVCMELVEGNTVAQMIETEGRLPAAVAATIMAQVLDALELAHGKQSVHRDVKPANIMVARDGTVKVMDFGLARRVAQMGRTKGVVGSPAYMAPEQLAGKPIDGRADVFAVGASLYEMLTGQLPFPGMARFEAPESPRSLQPEIPEALAAVVMRALDFEEGRRFSGAAEMASEVRAFVDVAGAVSLAVSAPVTDAPAQPPAVPSAARVHAPSSNAPSAASSSGETEPEPMDLELRELSFGESPDGADAASLDKPAPVEPSLRLEDLASLGDPPAPIVEEAPDLVPRQARKTPRTPIPAVGPSIGAYRILRPSQPDVYTPRPATAVNGSEERTPTPNLRRKSASGDRAGAARRPSTPSPGPSPSSDSQRGLGEPQTPRARATLGGVSVAGRGNTPRPSKTPQPIARTNLKSPPPIPGAALPRSGK